jgi:hypothetical protein
MERTEKMLADYMCYAYRIKTLIHVSWTHHLGCEGSNKTKLSVMLSDCTSARALLSVGISL